MISSSDFLGGWVLEHTQPTDATGTTVDNEAEPHGGQHAILMAASAQLFGRLRSGSLGPPTSIPLLSDSQHRRLRTQVCQVSRQA